MKGYAGKIGIVDLSKGSVTTQNLEEKFAKEFLGGNGFGIYFLNKLVNKNINSLSSENVLIFVTGPLTGTTLPRTGRFGLYAKSPLTGFLGESYCGGTFGPWLKFSGFDVLIVKGAAKKPVYIDISEKIEIKGTTDLWGLGNFETEKILLERIGEGSVASIGQAGENQVFYASVHSDFGRQAGRTGMGAVMGSKNLKAVVVHGDVDLEVYELEKIQEYVRKRNPEIVKDKDFDLDRKYGTAEWIKWASSVAGFLPTKNFESGYFEQDDNLDPYKNFSKYVKRAKGCMACNQPCGLMFSLPSGKYVEGPEYETAYALGSDCLNSDLEKLAEANYLCDDYGMDTISAGAVIAWAMEASEKNIIKEKIPWGDEETILEMIKKIAFKEGIGKTLSLGVKKSSEILGGKNFAVHSKGLEPPAYDVRGLKGLALAFAVSSRGACHLRSCFYAIDLSKEFKPLGLKGGDRFVMHGKVEKLKLMEDLMTLYDCLIICKFNRRANTLENLADFVRWVTGFEYTGKQLMEIASKVNDMEHEFNLKQGWTKNDDNLPLRFFEPQPLGAAKGQRIEKEELEREIGEYYKLRRW